MRRATARNDQVKTGVNAFAGVFGSLIVLAAFVVFVSKRVHIPDATIVRMTCDGLVTDDYKLQAILGSRVVLSQSAERVVRACVCNFSRVCAKGQHMYINRQ